MWEFKGAVCVLSVRAERDTRGLVNVYQIILDKQTLVIFSGYLGKGMAPERYFAFKTSLLVL